MEKLNLKFLQSLATQYPSVAKACTEIINLQAILNLPKETSILFLMYMVSMSSFYIY